MEYHLALFFFFFFVILCFSFYPLKRIKRLPLLLFYSPTPPRSSQLPSFSKGLPCTIVVIFSDIKLCQSEKEKYFLMNANNQFSYKTQTFLSSKTNLNFQYSRALQKDFGRPAFQIVLSINRVAGGSILVKTC